MANLVSSTLTGNLTVTANVSAANYTGNGAALTGIASFDSGTKMVFYQASAPTGWTQDTASALSNTVMAVVTGTGGGTGGATSYFSSFLATTDKSGTDTAPVTGSVAGTVGGHTLSTPEIASHVHNVRLTPGNPFSGQIRQGGGQDFGNKNTDSAGGGGSHSHPFSGSLSSATADVSVTVPAANVKYANVIVATKD
jgi:hypothetical protein